MQVFNMFGTSTNFLYKGDLKYKTTFGAILSLVIIIIMIYTTFYFGLEIFQKNKPTVRFNKEYKQNSTIFLHSYPLIFYISDYRGLSIPNFENIFDIKGVSR